MRNNGKPILKKNQAIISTDTNFGIRDYFLVTIIKKSGKKMIIKDDIDIDHWIETIKMLKVDYSDRQTTGYCLPGTSFREEWKAIPEHKKLPV